MPLVARGNSLDVVAILHDGGLTTTLTGSPDVFVGGDPIHRVDDYNTEHTVGDSTHSTKLAVGSSTVFANGKAVGRIGDTYSCGAAILLPAQITVYAGG